MKGQEWLHLILLIVLFLLGVSIGNHIAEPELEVVARNKATCQGCGAETIVEIKEKK